MISTMHRSKHALIVAGLIGSLFAPAMRADPPRIALDKQCFTIDGHDTFIYSASFHYFRCPKPLWRDRFKKLKEAGFNTVETYAAWDWHERTPPANVEDFSHVDMTDLDDWLKMAEDEFGFYVIVRPGPYICAEWDGGGYPQWLTLFRPKGYVGNWYRGDDAEYLKWCRHWYAAVAKTVVPHLLTHKPAGGRGVILWQLENEYDFAGKSAKEMHGQVAALGHMSREFGIDVPMFTCLTHNDALHDDPWIAANVFESANLYPGFGLPGVPGRVAYLDKYQPDKPKVITELQGGWFATFGNKLSDQQGHTAAQIQQLTLLMWQLGFTSTNYYMGFGGTNLGDWAAANLMTTYDYNAPVRETGGVTDRYLAVKGMGAFIAAQGDRLTRAEAMPIDVVENTDNDVLVVVRMAKDGTRFVFVHTADRDGPHQGTVRFVAKGASVDTKPTIVRYELPPFGAKVCVLPFGVEDDSKGIWYPEPAAAPQRPVKLPDPIEITSVRRMYDAVPKVAESQPYKDGQSVEDMGIFDRRTTLYTADVDLRSLLAKGAKPSLTLWLPDRDDATVIVNGQRVLPVARNGGETSFRIDNAKTDGTSSVTIVYENGGRPNAGPGMERRNGLSSASFSDSTAVGLSLHNWKTQPIENTSVESVVKPEFDDHAWPVVSADHDDGDQPEHATYVYRTQFDLAASDMQFGHELNIRRIDDLGSIYVNGVFIAKHAVWDRPFREDISKLLKQGSNVIAVVIDNDNGPGGLARGVTLRPIRGDDVAINHITWNFFPGTLGMQQGWSRENVDDSSWESVPLTGRPIEADAVAPLAWYRASFTLPANDPHAWIPWKARLNITGNAFLYLNGQPLGRYWNAGPQKDFYLPECWLKPGESNVITTAVRGLNKPEVRSISVLPYADQAEAR